MGWAFPPNSSTSRSKAGTARTAKRLVHGHANGEFEAPSPGWHRRRHAERARGWGPHAGPSTIVAVARVYARGHGARIREPIAPDPRRGKVTSALRTRSVGSSSAWARRNRCLLLHVERPGSVIRQPDQCSRRPRATRLGGPDEQVGGCQLEASRYTHLIAAYSKLSKLYNELLGDLSKQADRTPLNIAAWIQMHRAEMARIHTEHNEECEELVTAQANVDQRRSTRGCVTFATARIIAVHQPPETARSRYPAVSDHPTAPCRRAPEAGMRDVRVHATLDIENRQAGPGRGAVGDVHVDDGMPDRRARRPQLLEPLEGEVN